jgi:hypothetical protein
MFGFPPAIIFIFGRDEVFNLSARYYDAHNEASAGAFIGEMLTHDFVSGEIRTVHCRRSLPP